MQISWQLRNCPSSRNINIFMLSLSEEVDGATKQHTITCARPAFLNVHHLIPHSVDKIGKYGKNGQDKPRDCPDLVTLPHEIGGKVKRSVTMMTNV